MRDGYLIRAPNKVRAFKAMDAALSLLPITQHAVPMAPAQILVANWAHLGDVTTTMGAIRTLREWFPAVRIGMIVGSWGKVAAVGPGLVDAVHVIDHPVLNRSDMTRGKKLRRYAATRMEAMRDIRGARYDVGIDFFPFFPPAHPLFYQAGIPVRVGFDSGGFGPLLTHRVAWPDEDLPMAEHYRHLISGAWPDRMLPAGSMRPRMDENRLVPLPPTLADVSGYIVLHPGAGAPTRNWGPERWIGLLDLLREDAVTTGRKVVITGAGARDEEIAASLATAAPWAINLAGKLSWDQFVATIARADIVVCPDTVTSHIAALFDRPLVCLFTGTVKASQWGPYAGNATILIQDVACAPCNRWGCDAMACIRETTPDQVIRAMRQTLARSSGTIAIR